MLRAAQARNSLAQPQALRSRNETGIWRGQDPGVSILSSSEFGFLEEWSLKSEQVSVLLEHASNCMAMR